MHGEPWAGRILCKTDVFFAVNATVWEDASILPFFLCFLRLVGMIILSDSSTSNDTVELSPHP